MEHLEFVIERRILHIGNHLIAVRNRDLKRFGLTSSQSETLPFIEQHEGTPIVSLKEHLDVSHQAVQKTVGKLRERGLVTVSVSPEDARVKNVSLSQDGKQLCAELKRAGAISGDTVLKGLNDSERVSLLALLSKIDIG